MPGFNRMATILAMLFVSGAALAQPAPGPDAASFARGRDLALRICGSCHIVGPGQRVAPSLRPAAPPFAALVNRPGTTRAQLVDVMSRPHGRMPDPELADYQTVALADYMLSLRRRQ